MGENINIEFGDFVRSHADEDPQKLRLKYRDKNLPFEVEFAILQIECRKKYRNKFKTLLKDKNFIFPNLLAAEQSTHEAVAKYHSELIKKGERILDMTAGLGTDSIFMAMNGGEVTAIELDENKFEALMRNKESIGVKMDVIHGDSVKFLKETDEKYDIIFIDPARRDIKGGKVFLLEDCQPNIKEIKELMRNRAKRIMIKLSPMLDVTSIINQLDGIAKIKTISVAGECKEVFVELGGKEKGETEKIEAQAIDLRNNGDIISSFKFDFTKDNAVKKYNYPDESQDLKFEIVTKEDIQEGVYLYEPNASVMKFMPWNELMKKYPPLKKIGPSSHLFISQDYINDFPGRKLKILSLITKKDRRALEGTPVNVVTRNFRETPEMIRKKLKLKEGKEKFLYATTLSEKEPVMILAQLCLNPFF